MKPQRTCPCHATAEEHAAFEAVYVARVRAYTVDERVADLPKFNWEDDDFDDADGCICGDPRCEG